MRFSILTLVVFVAHASTQATAAPLPIYDEVQDLVARTDSTNNWARIASKLAQKVPAPLVNTPTKSDAITAIQKSVHAAAKAGPYRTGDHIPRPAPPPPRDANAILKAWNKKTGNMFTQPGKGTPPWGGVHRVPKPGKRDPEIDEIDWVN